MAMGNEAESLPGKYDKLQSSLFALQSHRATCLHCSFVSEHLQKISRIRSGFGPGHCKLEAHGQRFVYHLSEISYKGIIFFVQIGCKK